MNNDLQEKIEEVITKHNLILPNEKIIIAVSGGPDSMTLLLTLNELKKKINFEIYVAHVNHKIRDESEQEKKYVENFCQKIKVPFYYLEKDVISEAKEHKMGVEEYARKIRYDFFNELKEKIDASKIAIAHNLNDKVETMLFNMMRGCSLKGLIGMEYVTGDIIRPMLDIKKEEILEYCEVNNINPCIDKTNFQSIYTRNKIRLELIPMIENNFNPNFIDSMNRMSSLIVDDEAFIEKYAQNIVDESIISTEKDNIIFNYKKIMCEDKAIQTRSVRKIINKLMKNVQGIEKKHILDIINLMQKNITGKMYIIGNKFTIKILKKDTAKIYLNY